MPETKDDLRVLVVDDEVNIRKTLSVCLEKLGHHSTAVSNYEDAIVEVKRRAFDLAFVDLRLGTASGLDLIPELLSVSPTMKIVVITAYASVDTAVEAMRRGAVDYIPKPFTPAQVKIVAQKIGEMRALEHRVELLQGDLHRLNPEANLASNSQAMQRAVEMAKQVAPSEAIALMRGESGTGKTVLARAIHDWSHRANRPFVVVSCPTLSPELLESELFGHAKGAFTGAVRDFAGRIAGAEGGTLFLDEIGDLPISLQPKLLRFLQDREYERVGENVTRTADVRLIAATNTDLEEAIKERRFREDLYYRLNGFQIQIPPLRERLEDLEILTQTILEFFARANRKLLRGFSKEAFELLRKYSWPGNLRELRNVVERAAIVARSEWILPSDFPDNFVARPDEPRPGDPVSLERLEEVHIRRILASTKSLQEAADILGIDQATLWRKRKTYGI